MIDQKEAAIERHLAAFRAKDADAEPWSADAEVIAAGARLRGREQILDWLQGWWEAFPDARLKIVRSISSGPLTAAEGMMTGTHTGVLRTPQGEVAPTDRSVHVGWRAMYEADGDELRIEHLYFDPGEFLTQLGLGADSKKERTT